MKHIKKETYDINYKIITYEINLTKRSMLEYSKKLPNYIHELCNRLTADFGHKYSQCFQLFKMTACLPQK